MLAGWRRLHCSAAGVCAPAAALPLAAHRPAAPVAIRRRGHPQHTRPDQQPPETAGGQGLPPHHTCLWSNAAADGLTACCAIEGSARCGICLRCCCCACDCRQHFSRAFQLEISWCLFLAAATAQRTKLNACDLFSCFHLVTCFLMPLFARFQCWTCSILRLICPMAWRQPSS